MRKRVVKCLNNLFFWCEGFYLTVPSEIKLCEETKGVISGKTELERLCWVRPKLQLAGRARCGLRRGRPGQARVTTSPPHPLPESRPRSPSKSAVLEKWSPTEDKTCKFRHPRGFPKKGRLTRNRHPQSSPEGQCCLCTPRFHQLLADWLKSQRKKQLRRKRQKTVS